MNFRNRGSLKIYGDVKVNGQVVTSSEAIASISGYVQQDDLFIGTLKVREHLMFQVSFIHSHLKCLFIQEHNRYLNFLLEG